MSDLMVVSYKGLRFEKLDTGAMVNVYNEKTGENVYCFTHDGLGDNYKAYREYCIEFHPDIIAELNTY